MQAVLFLTSFSLATKDFNSVIFESRLAKLFISVSTAFLSAKVSNFCLICSFWALERFTNEETLTLLASINDWPLRIDELGEFGKLYGEFRVLANSLFNELMSELVLVNCSSNCFLIEESENL
ncbi:hypothetical protein MALH07_00403 [Mycoplasma anatis]|nr:hypothetical protein [Mycoplasmopsis anatis]MBW0601287.1 hypothetical protein [Mycoplasmopsis anatis]